MVCLILKIHFLLVKIISFRFKGLMHFIFNTCNLFYEFEKNYIIKLNYLNIFKKFFNPNRISVFFSDLFYLIRRNGKKF